MASSREVAPRPPFVSVSTRSYYSNVAVQRGGLRRRRSAPVGDGRGSFLGIENTMILSFR